MDRLPRRLSRDVQIQVRKVPRSVRDSVKAVAARRGMSLSEFLIELMVLAINADESRIRRASKKRVYDVLDLDEPEEEEEEDEL